MGQPKSGRAFFVNCPRVIGDLRRPFRPEQEKEYEILGVVWLKKIDYENFITDMTVARAFLAENMDGCAAGEVVRCLLVMGEDFPGGVLAVPKKDGHVVCAALYDK